MQEKTAQQVMGPYSDVNLATRGKNGAEVQSHNLLSTTDSGFEPKYFARQLRILTSTRNASPAQPLDRDKCGKRFRAHRPSASESYVRFSLDWK